MSQKAYNDLRLEVKSNESLKKKLEEKDTIISDLKNSDTGKGCNCEEALKQQKMNHESLKKKHEEKVKLYNDLKRCYESSKKENTFNRKQSEQIVKEKQYQINDLIKQVNSLIEYKMNSTNKKDHEILQDEYRKLKLQNS